MHVLMASLLLIPISGFALDAPASLVPAGVSPGSQFYLIFTTSGTIEATSTDMSDYDAFVNADAQVGTSLPGVSSLTWKALGATSTVDQCKPFIDLTKPVYTVTKVLVSTTASAMFSGGVGQILNSNPGVTPSGGTTIGGPPNTALTWTGCESNGSPAIGNQLGSGSRRTGLSIQTNSLWITFLNFGPGRQPLYAVSPLLTAPPIAPAATTNTASSVIKTATVYRTREHPQSLINIGFRGTEPSHLLRPG
jgi:hypothetical protein